MEHLQVTAKFFVRINIAKKPALGSNFCYARTIFISNNSFTFPEDRSSQAATKSYCGKMVFDKCVFKNIPLKLVSKSFRNTF